MVAVDGQGPELEGFGLDHRQGLRQGDFVQEPICAAKLGEMPRAIGIDDAGHQCVPIPMLAASYFLLGQTGINSYFLDPTNVMESPSGGRFLPTMTNAK